ncbi:UNVERIFIED_CONTAM: hypothetical protein HHA_311270 [Hammondia hammondi]|eukprot:XP_008884522.1 hypothetical protein HHA_311270 [Hammondia hammondi]
MPSSSLRSSSHSSSLTSAASSSLPCASADALFGSASAGTAQNSGEGKEQGEGAPHGEETDGGKKRRAEGLATDEETKRRRTNDGFSEVGGEGDEKEGRNHDDETEVVDLEADPGAAEKRMQRVEEERKRDSADEHAEGRRQEGEDETPENLGDKEREDSDAAGEAGPQSSKKAGDVEEGEGETEGKQVAIQRRDGDNQAKQRPTEGEHATDERTGNNKEQKKKQNHATGLGETEEDGPERGDTRPDVGEGEKGGDVAGGEEARGKEDKDEGDDVDHREADKEAQEHHEKREQPANEGTKTGRGACGEEAEEGKLRWRKKKHRRLQEDLQKASIQPPSSSAAAFLAIEGDNAHVSRMTIDRRRHPVSRQ